MARCCNNTASGLAVAPAWRFDTFSRDVIDLGKAIDRLQVRTGWLDRCMQAMTINTVPKALLWQKIRRLRRVLPSG